ncbi:transcription antitermination factor NusB [Liberiplasma polymorphum]|uniref:transcription antitermination factor NusB n=1 Tax=Liberiplasma polymorphum TaxID=3374570 RepID=UPI003773E84B
MKSRREQRALIIEELYKLDMNDMQKFTLTEFEFVDEMIQGILDNLPKIDTLISEHLERWTLKRVSYVDRAILRLAVYEMYATDTPAEIIINEALNLTRTFTDEGDSKAVSFNNSVLDKIKKTVNK